MPLPRPAINKGGREYGEGTTRRVVYLGCEFPVFGRSIYGDPIGEVLSRADLLGSIATCDLGFLLEDRWELCDDCNELFLSVFEADSVGEIQVESRVCAFALQSDATINK